MECCGVKTGIYHLATFQGNGGREKTRRSTRLNKPPSSFSFIGPCVFETRPFLRAFFSIGRESCQSFCKLGFCEFYKTGDRFFDFLLNLGTKLWTCSAHIRPLGSDRQTMAPKKPVKGGKAKGAYVALLWLDDAFTSYRPTVRPAGTQGG